MRRSFLAIFAPLAFIALAGCSLLTNQSQQVQLGVYTLDKALAVTDGALTTAIKGGVITDAALIAKIKAGAQIAHDSLTAATQAEKKGDADAAVLFNVAVTDFAALSGLASKSGVSLPATALPPAPITAN